MCSPLLKREAGKEKREGERRSKGKGNNEKEKENGKGKEEEERKKADRGWEGKEGIYLSLESRI